MILEGDVQLFPPEVEPGDNILSRFGINKAEEGLSLTPAEQTSGKKFLNSHAISINF